MMVDKRRFKLVVQDIIPTEKEECIAFWEYCQVKLKLGMSVFHVPNEGHRYPWYTNMLKKIGLTPGVLDYIFLIPNSKWHALIIDMKRQNERHKKKRPEQEAFIANASKQGYYATYAYGCQDAIQVYMDYVNNRL